MSLINGVGEYELKKYLIFVIYTEKLKQSQIHRSLTVGFLLLRYSDQDMVYLSRRLLQVASYINYDIFLKFKNYDILLKFRI